MQTTFVFVSFVFCLITAAQPLPHNGQLRNKNVVANLFKSKASDLTYYFYSRSNTEGTSIKSEDAVPNIFDSQKGTLFFIHGWLDKFSSESATLVRTAALEAYDINVVVVDWSPIADSINYFEVKDGVPSVGTFFGNFIQNLTITHNVSPAKIAIAGHSLGAHIAGIAGKILNSEVDHITGLDPAAPFVDESDTDYTLDPSDAKFVQVIHTSGGKLGMKDSLGHADYYPNGGSKQPGCTNDLVGSCAHIRAFKFFAESIGSNNFYAKSCESYNEFSKGSCSGSISWMGGYEIDKEASGNYYLKTNEDSPYAMGPIE